MKRFSKYLVWTILVVIILFVGYRMFASLAFSGAFDKKYTAEEAIQNFDSRERDILDLAEYFREHKPKSHEVWFSGNTKEFDISIGLPRWAVMEKFPNKHGRDLKLNTPEADTLLSTIGWTNETVSDLTQKLKKSNCLNISSDEDVVTVLYRTGTWSSYSYVVFAKPISDSLRKVYDEAKVRMLRDNVKLATSHAL